MVIVAVEVAVEVEVEVEGVLLHRVPEVAHLLVTNLVLEEEVKVQVVGQKPVSIEMIDESANLVPAEHLKTKIEMV